MGIYKYPLTLLKFMINIQEDSSETTELPCLSNLGKTINFELDQDKIAVAFVSNGQSKKFSYHDIENLSNNMAAFLSSSGIKKGDKVAICAKNSVEYLITIFAVFRLGAVLVPLNYKYNLDDLEHIIKDCQAKLTFTDDSNRLPNFLDLKFTVNNLKNYNKIEPITIEDEDEGLILYTSGSSGFPKGVSIKHKSHLWMVEKFRNKDRKYGAKRVCLICAPFYHMNGLSTIQSAIAGHATTILLEEFNAKFYVDVLEKIKVNTIYAVTPMLAMILQEEKIYNLDLSHIRVIYMASSPLSEKLLNDLKIVFPNAYFYNSYGTTETGPRIFGQHPNKDIPRPPMSVGYPREEISIRLIDGILQIKSPHMFSSYNNRQDILNQSLTEDGYFITNDIFEVDENGFYYFVGRADDMFKSGGNTVYPSKIQELLESHPGVKSAQVIGLDDEIKGKKPYAFVIPNTKLVEKDLQDYIAKKAPAYMIPRKIYFIDQFPLLAVNKIDKKKLIQMATENLTKA